MHIDRDDLALLTAARDRKPGALRQLAVHLDQQLADEDRPLDGVVMAWQAVRRPTRRTRTLHCAGIAGWLTGAARRREVDRSVATDLFSPYAHQQAGLFDLEHLLASASTSSVRPGRRSAVRAPRTGREGAMDPDTLHERLDKVQVVDVRYPNEWEAGRINGAVHIPEDYLYERTDQLDRNKPIVTVCKSGSRSDRAAEWLREHDFDAENLDGGMDAWAKAGLDHQADDGRPGTIAEPEPPPDERPPEMQQLQEGLLDVIFAAQEHFGDHEPNDEEMRGFLRHRLLSDGKTPEEADEFLANMGKD